MLSGACPRPWSRIFYLYLIYTIWLQFIVLSLFTVYFVRKERTLLQEQDFVPNLLYFPQFWNHLQQSGNWIRMEKNWYTGIMMSYFLKGLTKKFQLPPNPFNMHLTQFLWTFKVKEFFMHKLKIQQQTSKSLFYRYFPCLFCRLSVHESWQCSFFF